MPRSVDCSMISQTQLLFHTMVAYTYIPAMAKLTWKNHSGPCTGYFANKRLLRYALQTFTFSWKSIKLFHATMVIKLVITTYLVVLI